MKLITKPFTEFTQVIMTDIDYSDVSPQPVDYNDDYITIDMLDLFPSKKYNIQIDHFFNC
mgnify:CR=1 FL=1